MDSNHNNTEIPADLPEEQASQLIVKDFPIFRATTPFPGVSSKAKDTENCLYILLRIIKQLILFFA